MANTTSYVITAGLLRLLLPPHKGPGGRCERPSATCARCVAQMTGKLMG